MKTETKKRAALAAVALLLLVSIIFTGIFYGSNRNLHGELNSEKLRSEALLSEKLLLQKEIDEFRTTIQSLQGKNTELDDCLSDASAKLKSKEEEVKNLLKENSSVKALKKQIADLKMMKSDFERQIAALNGKAESLASENQNLNKELASLKEENKMLAQNLEILSSMTADNFLVQATRKKDKLTVMARRARKIQVSFKVPENLTASISFKITRPDGKQVEGKENGIACNIVNDDAERETASLSGTEIKVSKKVEMVYEPKERLSAGVYKIEMFNKDKYMGSCQVKLR